MSQTNQTGAQQTSHNKLNIGLFFAFLVATVAILWILFFGSRAAPKISSHTTQVNEFQYHAVKEQKILKDNRDLNSWSMQHIQMEPVERVEWAPHLPFTSALLQMREPTILTNTVVTQWRAMELWKQDGYLANHPSLAMINNARICTAPTFETADNNTPLGKVAAKLNIDMSSNYKEVNMSGPEFFSKLTNASDPLYYYWYGKVEGTLKNDVYPSDFLWANAESRYAFGLYMWLSEAEVGPPIHYDQDHNFFVHVSGSKRFVLFPPWEWRNLHAFPRIHPKWHKSQVEFDGPNLTVTPDYPKATAYIAELNPGEVLYVPPYWWHHVRAHSVSVSLASWSDSGVYNAMKAGLYEVELDVDKITDPQEKIAAVAAFIRQILKELFGDEEAKKWLSDMFKSRWLPLKHYFEHLPAFTEPSLCASLTRFSAAHFKDKFSEDVNAAVESFNTCQGSGE
jgi:hypothetical protein